jgi:hypothetical protein
LARHSRLPSSLVVLVLVLVVFIILLVLIRVGTAFDWTGSGYFLAASFVYRKIPPADEAKPDDAAMMMMRSLLLPNRPGRFGPL